MPVVLLADHNSLVQPALDCAKPPKLEPKEVLDARAAEVRTLENLGLLDVWTHVHFDQQSLNMSKGYTWPAYTQDKDKGKTASLLRRLDRIHVPKEVADSASSVHTTFLGRSDHKAVQLPIFSHRPPQMEVPHEFPGGFAAC
uniref:Uncharacterized protein n=1 Tax=Eutreptiella gymnastica TaxID=73025 RepID=A0A6T2D756_9EUGL